MDWDVVITGVIGLLGGGAAKMLIDRSAKVKLKRLELDGKNEERDDKRRDDTVQVLREALDDERQRHGDCLTRVMAVERENVELRREVSVMHRALLAYVLTPEPDREEALRLLQSIRPSRP